MKAEDLVNEINEKDVRYEVIMNYLEDSDRLEWKNDDNKAAVVAQIIGHGLDSTGRFKLSRRLYALKSDEKSTRTQKIQAELHDFLSDIDSEQAEEIIEKFKMPYEKPDNTLSILHRLT